MLQSVGGNERTETPDLPLIMIWRFVAQYLPGKVGCYVSYSLEH